MDITNLDDRRPEAREPGYGGATCICGEAWFVLDGDNTAPNGVVCMNPDGVITGYMGRPRCMSCGHPYMKPQSYK